MDEQDQASAGEGSPSPHDVQPRVRIIGAQTASELVSEGSAPTGQLPLTQGAQPAGGADVVGGVGSEPGVEEVLGAPPGADQLPGQLVEEPAIEGPQLVADSETGALDTARALVESESSPGSGAPKETEPQGDASSPSSEARGRFAPELPHWTEPPTGQVPAVLDRGGGEQGADPLAQDTGPVWREHPHEWEHGDSFEPAMLADEETRIGALDEEGSLEERRPWEFAGTSEDAQSTAPEASVGDELDLQSAHWPQDLGSEAWERDHTALHPTLGDDGVEGSSSRWPEDPAEPAGSSPAAEEASPSGRGGRVRILGNREPLSVRGGQGQEILEVAHSAVTDPTTGLEAGDSLGGVGAEPADDLGPGDARRPHPGARVRKGAPGSTTTHGPQQRRLAARPSPSPSGRSGRNLPLAIAIGLAVAAVTLACMKVGPLATMILATVVITTSAGEYFGATRRAGRHPATLLGLVGTVAIMVAAYTKGVGALPLVLALMVMSTFVWYLAGVERGSPLRGASTTLLGFGWVGVLGSFASLLLAPSQFPQRHGVAFFFGAVVAVVSADVFALAVGAWIGRHPMAPATSPGKTWEGFVGGLVAAVVISWFLTGSVHPWTRADAALEGLVGGLLGPVGDLCESMIKRDLRLKDMGSLLPGHGGLLDRFDALLFVLPATYYLVRVLNLG